MKKTPFHLLPLLVLLLVITAVPLIELVNGNYPGSHLDEHWGWEEVRSGELAKRVQSELEENSIIANEVRPYYDLALLELFRKTTPKVVLGTDGWAFFARTVKDYPPPDALEKLPRTATLFRRVIAWFEARGTSVMMVLVPDKATIYPAQARGGQPGFVPAYEPVLEALRETGIRVMDLRPALSRAEEDTYYRCDTHWTRRTALHLAGEIARELCTRHPREELPGFAVKGALLVKGEHTFAGDLYRLLGLPEENPWREWGTISEPDVIAVFEGSEIPLLIFEPQPIAQVGTSFSTMHHMPALLSRELGRVVRSVTDGTHGSIIPLIALAQEVILGRSKAPEILIWEIPERFVYFEQRLFENALELFLRGADYERGPGRHLEYVAREASQVEVLEEDELGIRAVSRSQRSFLRYELPRPLPGDGSLALTFEMQCEERDYSIVRLEVGHGVPRTVVHSMIFGHHMRHLQIVPLRTASGEPIRAIEIFPVSRRAAFALGHPEVWERR